MAESMQVEGLGAGLTEARVREIYRQGEEAVVFAMMRQSQMIARAQDPAAPSPNLISPSTPSGMRPIYTKPPTPARRKRPGREQGHPGVCRIRPERVDQTQEHRLGCCPVCQGELKRCRRTRTRYIEDIPQDIQPVVTEHVIHRDWCPHCHKLVEPVVPDALPGAMLGHRVVALSSWLHYGLGQTLSQIVEVFGHHLRMELTPGGLSQMWQRFAEVLRPWYKQIQAEALQAAVLHGDETGWRVNGRTHWLWCFSTTDETLYMIDQSRGGPALRKFFREEFAGTLVCDFWGAYNAVICSRRQRCLVHLLRDLDYVETYRTLNQDWPTFAKTLRRLIGDGIRLWKREVVPPEEYASRRRRLTGRLQGLIAAPWEHPEARRLIKRLRRHQDELFTFLDHAGVPFENNHAERAIRPAVIIRKNSQCNRSQRGAETQAVLMSVYRTLKQRGHAPIDTMAQAMKTYLTTGQLPSLPPKTAPSG
ncbi:MAG: IS66 family transposase [Terriglobia bacterium]